jgi:hypothetical protein
MTNKTTDPRKTNLLTPLDEQRFRELGDRFVRSTDPEEQNRLKAELVRFILQGQASRQQQVIRDFADLCCAAGLA